MADAPEQEPAPDAEAKPSFVKKLAVNLAVGIVCGGIGFSIPVFVPSVVGLQSAEVSSEQPAEFLFLPFGDVVANIDEARLNRYLRVSITLQIEASKSREAELIALIGKKNSVMRSWLLSHMSDLKMDDIRGKAGQNRLRREVQDHFSMVLFPDGKEEIHDVLFVEFNIQ